MRKPLLTIGMIFKNEIRCLERCMKSLEPLRKAISCELIMADTGSSDGSREIAEKYADIVFDFPWIDDFSAARNAVIDRSSGKWFLTLDADEWLDSNIEEMVETLRRPKADFHILTVKIRNCTQLNVVGNLYNEFYAMRIMRNDIGIRYEGRIHEHYKYPNAERQAVCGLNMLVYHDGYAFASKDAEKAKWDRNMKLLKKLLEEDPDNLHILSQCMDSSQNNKEERIEYVHRALEVLHRKWDEWAYYGAKTYRDAVFIARTYQLPELLEWSDKAVELFPDSIFTKVDVAYSAYACVWDSNDMDRALYWGEMYRKGLSDYRSGNFNGIELIRGVLYFFAPFYERQMLIFMVKGYLNLKRYEDAFSVFVQIDGSELEEKEHVELCTHNLLKLQNVTERDLRTLTVRFWEQINQPTPSEEAAEMRRAAFLNIAAYSFLPSWREKELELPDFERYGYTALLPLEGKCVLGDAAAIMEISDPAELSARIAKQDITNFPISTLMHALECGMAFPLPGHDLTLEEMDALAGRMATFDKFLELAEAIPAEGFGIQQLCWKRTLLLAGVRSCKWDKDADMMLAQAFVAMERQFLSVCYAQSALTEEGSILLPPLHRFGWYCTRAFDSFEAGDVTNYVRLLRQGLKICPEMKPMVEFLVEQLEKNKRQQESPELLILAQQVRQILAQYAPGSPMVEEIKRSEAYQKVSYLLEDAKVIGFGGLPQ